MMDDVKYRNKYEANDMTEREELIYLKEENKKLREALKYIELCADRVLANGDKMDNPDIWVIQQEAKKALNR